MSDNQQSKEPNDPVNPPTSQIIQYNQQETVDRSGVFIN